MKTNSTNKTMTVRSMGLVVMPEDDPFVNKVFYPQGSSSEIRMEKGPIRLGDKIDSLKIWETRLIRIAILYQ